MLCEDFKRELRKFIARKGAPTVIYSDNAKTFQKASRWIKDYVKRRDIENLLEEHEITWKFNLPLAPWWGGFYERLIGLVKRSLRKTLEKARLTFEELEVIITEVEAALNNRPLTYQGEEVSQALTPSHLMYGYSLPQISEGFPLIEREEEDRLQKRLRYLQERKKHLWNRW